MADDTRPFTHSMKGEGGAKNLETTPKVTLNNSKSNRAGIGYQHHRSQSVDMFHLFQLSWVNGMEYQEGEYHGPGLFGKGSRD
jgi:hypothetical protein